MRTVFARAALRPPHAHTFPDCRRCGDRCGAVSCPCAGRRRRASPQAAVDAVRPLAVIDREGIALSGMRTVSDLLASRQRFNSFGLNRVLFLGSRVAYLIDGRRISDSTLDLSTLPISAVERIEILSGSAAALHGVHAIAGAINIVLRRGNDGVEASAFAARPTDAGGDMEQGSA